MIDLTVLSFVALFALAFSASFGMPGAMVGMLSVGALAATSADLLPIIIVVAIGSILGDIASYELARRFSSPVTRLLARFRFYRENKAKAQSLLLKSEFFFVFFTRFMFTALGAPMNYIAGFERLSRRTFLFAVVLGEMLYASIYPILGFLFKETWSDLYAFISNFFAVILLLVLTVATIYYWRRARRQTVD